MKMLLKMNMDNAAFGDDANKETARILRELAERLEKSFDVDIYILRDHNGNNVGSAKILK